MPSATSRSRPSLEKAGRALAIFGAVLLLTLTTPVFGTAQPLIEPEVSNKQTHLERSIDGFPVTLDQKPLLYVRRGFGPFTAEERASTISRRIERIARDDSISVEDLKMVKSTYDNSFYLSTGRELFLTVHERDARDNRSTPEMVAQKSLQSIKDAISQYRQDRKPERLLRNIMLTAIASIAFIGVSIFAIKISGKVFPLVGQFIASRMPETRIKDIKIIPSSVISAVSLKLLKLIRLFLLLVLLLVYATFVLRLFPWTRNLGESIAGHFYQSLELVVTAIGNYLPNVFVITIIIIITSYITKAMKIMFRALESEHFVVPGFYADWAKPTYNLLLVVVIALAAVLAFPYLPGFDSPAFRGISVFLGLLLSLGSSSAITNIIGGIIFIYTRAFRIGDHIQIGDVIGDIVETSFLAIRVCTPSNQIITIPNSTLLSGKVINYNISSRELNRYPILQTTITLGYDLSWRKVNTTLIEAALATEHILREPAPFVLQTSLDNHYISYQLNAYTSRPNLMVLIYSELHQSILDRCNEAGIEILSPSYTSLRDGNAITIPKDYLPLGYVAPPFCVASSEINVINENNG
ncbi:mechanosensitive ion channel family protein [Synechococcus sp. J7-Johnson]|nr:mechanosensitive ion channel family protein [Synechococcus sp. J7-Johnson]